MNIHADGTKASGAKRFAKSETFSSELFRQGAGGCLRAAKLRNWADELDRLSNANGGAPIAIEFVHQVPDDYARGFDVDVTLGFDPLSSETEALRQGLGSRKPVSESELNAFMSDVALVMRQGVLTSATLRGWVDLLDRINVTSSWPTGEYMLEVTHLVPRDFPRGVWPSALVRLC